MKNYTDKEVITDEIKRLIEILERMKSGHVRCSLSKVNFNKQVCPVCKNEIVVKYDYYGDCPKCKSWIMSKGTRLGKTEIISDLLGIGKGRHEETKTEQITEKMIKLVENYPSNQDDEKSWAKVVLDVLIDYLGYFNNPDLNHLNHGLFDIFFVDSIDINVFLKSFDEAINRMTKRGVPIQLLRRVKRIIVDHESDFSSWAGVYRVENIHVMVGKKSDFDNLVYVIIHEFGHLIYEIANKRLRLLWDDHWESGRKIDGPTDYSMTNKFENFAEIFTYWILYPEKNPPLSNDRIEEVSHWIKEARRLSNIIR